jgi:glycosyltransferase involved in cell wall biosynthesis
VPRVSVIIPAHNSAGTLPETLGSVVAQSFSDWEAVVADDLSSDGTADAAEGVDDRIRVIRSAVNRGPAGARNLALEHASGELVALLDADDLWLPDYLEQQVALFDRASADGRAVGIVACDAYLLAGEERLPRTYSELYGTPAGIGVERLLRENPVYVSAMVARSVLDEVGPFSTETFGSEDHDLWLRIVETGREVVYNPHPLAVYRVGSASVSADGARMARTAQATYRFALARGRLSPRERRTAERELRLQRAVEAATEVRAAWASGERVRGVRRAARSLPLFTRVAAERRDRWGRWFAAARGKPRDPLESIRRTGR